MTPKEKAEELFIRYYKLDMNSLYVEKDHAKEMTLICVDEMIKLVDLHCIDPTSYWQQVKKEVEKL